MSVTFEISFTSEMPAKGELAILTRLAGDAVAAGAAVADPQNVIAKAEKTSAFTGKSLATLDILAPHGSGFERLVVLGLGKPDKINAHSWLKAGGVAASKCAKAMSMVICLDADGAGVTAASAADFALGMHLRGYSFDKYKTRKKDDDKEITAKTVKVTLVTAHAREAVDAYATAKSIADGVVLARDLVNEPANVLGPIEFAAKAKALEALGVVVEILTEKEMTALGMGALLAVAQGSVRPPRMAVMQWNGGKAGEKPVAFVGKGVVFDTGGISIKPAGGMEDMKGDMGGAAAVTGLMHVLAAAPVVFAFLISRFGWKMTPQP